MQPLDEKSRLADVTSQVGHRDPDSQISFGAFSADLAFQLRETARH